MKDKPDNCIIWGERNDVDKFMKACDVFYFSSVLELNPLVVKEALSWKMPVLMYDLPTYMGSYSNNENITILNSDRNVASNALALKRVLDTKVIPFMQENLSRCKLVHIVSDIFSEMEQASIKSVSALADRSSSIEYTIHYNPPAKEIPSNRVPMFNNSELKPGHFGCFEAFRKAIEEDFSDDYDYLIVCERDCILETTPDEIVELLKKTFNVMERENVTYFSFGDKVDLDHCYLQSTLVSALPGGFSYVTDKIIGLQFIIFNREGRDFLKTQFATTGWYGMDIWLNEVYNKNNKKMGILNQRVTTQLDGYSIIDNVDKTFTANKK